jgi:hypothetical protein
MVGGERGEELVAEWCGELHEHRGVEGWGEVASRAQREDHVGLSRMVVGSGGGAEEGGEGGDSEGACAGMRRDEGLAQHEGEVSSKVGVERNEREQRV